MLTPNQWLARELSRKRWYERFGTVNVASFPFQPWEDHVIAFHSIEEAEQILMRTVHQIKQRRKRLGLGLPDPHFQARLAEANHYERKYKAGRTRHELKLAA